MADHIVLALTAVTMVVAREYLLGGQATGKLAPKLLSGSQNRAAATSRFVMQGAAEKIRCQLSLVVRKQVAMEMADHEAHARHYESDQACVEERLFQVRPC